MKAKVKLNNKVVGYLEKNDQGIFSYSYVQGYNGPAISRSFKGLSTLYQRTDGSLFPFFAGLLSEGAQKTLQCRLLKIDEADEYTRLVKTAANTIGAITVHPAEE